MDSSPKFGVVHQPEGLSELVHGPSSNNLFFFDEEFCHSETNALPDIGILNRRNK